MPPHQHHELAQQLRRRRDAAGRCEPLPGGRRDPWLDLDDDQPQTVTEAAIDAWLDAAHHVGAFWAIPAELQPFARRRWLQRTGQAA